MHKLTLRQRIFFGVGKFGTAIFMQVVTIATVYIYGSAFQLDYTLNAIGNAVGKIFIAFSGFIFGYISDILKNPRWGRRKFFVWTGTPILALSFVMLFIPHFFIPLDKEYLVFTWLLIWYALFNLFYGYIGTPYQAWMPEVTTEDDRVSMSAIQNTTNLFATIGGLAFAFIFSGMLDAEQSITLTLRKMPLITDKIEIGGLSPILGHLGIILLGAVLIFAVIEVLAFIPALLGIKEEPVERKERNILREFKIVLSNRNYVLWFITQGIYSMGLTILTALTFDLIGFLGLTGMLDFAVFAVAMFGTTMLSFILWEKLSNKIGKRISLLISYGCLILILPLTLVLGKIPFIPSNVQTWIFGVLLGFGLSTTYLLPNAVIADLADEDERITKESRAGMYTGFNSIPLNIFQASAYLLVPFIYNPEPGATYWGLQWLGPAVAFFFLLSIPTIIIGKYDPFLDLIKASAKVKKIEDQKDR